MRVFGSTVVALAVFLSASAGTAQDVSPEQAEEIVRQVRESHVVGIERTRFEITHFVGRAEIEKDRSQIRMLFPPAVASGIEAKLEEGAASEARGSARR